MNTASILLLALGLFATVAMARPGGRRPWFGGHHHGNEVSEGRQWLTYRLPSAIRLPRLLTGTLGQPFPTFTAKKILNGKYLLVSPALIFKLKEVDNETELSTTAVPESSTTDVPDSVETSTIAVDEETTTVAVDEDTTTDPESEGEEEESTTVAPDFFGKRSFANSDDEDLLFFDN